MKLKYCVAALAMGVAGSASAQTVAATSDSLRILDLNEAVVMAVKAPKHAPFAVANIGKAELSDFSRTGQELPHLFSRTPGVVAWSENGVGTGTTYMRMRGSSGSRINVTLDGVSLNSPEDQTVFWANMNSYASLLGGVQIQRGVGSSTNGDGAFGGSIALNTKAPAIKPQLEVTGSYGSYNTAVYGGNFSTGLFAHNQLILDGAWHETRTDGYMHGTAGRSGSYYGGLTFLSKDRSVKVSYKNIGNYEMTGQAWNGIDTYNLLDWNYGGMGTGIMGFKDLYNAGLGKFNNLYERLNDKGDATQGTSRYTMADGSLWKGATDNFWQNHNLLSLVWNIDEQWKMNLTGHYTHGHGYYEELKYDSKLSKFGLAKFPLSNGETLTNTDFVRRKGLTQDGYGVVWNVNYQSDKLDFIMGASLQAFQCNHWGYLTYIKDEELRAAYLTDGKYHYYDSDAWKDDGQVFAKATWHVTNNFDLFGDVQYRGVHYTTNGINDKFYKNSDGTYSNQRLDIKKDYNFLNPKLGLSYHRNGHNAYASYALSHREPERNNFTDNGGNGEPHHETLHDFELGYSFRTARFHAGAGAYAMIYDNQLVQTGELSDIGEYLTANLKDSYRLGVELSAGVNVTKWFSLEANAALSQNKVKNFDEVVEDWDNYDTGVAIRHYDKSTLAFSPSAIVNGFADFRYRGFKATWHTGFVSKQYIDNTACDQRSLDAYTRTDVALSYDLKCWQKGLKNVIFGVNLNNIFNAHYAQNAWVYNALCASEGNPEGNRYTEIGYVPAAGFTAMGSVTFRF